MRMLPFCLFCVVERLSNISLYAHRETDRFFAASGVQLAQSTSDLYHYKRVTFSSQLKNKCVNILAKSAALRITLNVDVAPVASRSHTHPSHSQNARLLTSSVSLGITVPHPHSVGQTCTSLRFNF